MITTWFDRIMIGDTLTTRGRTITETDIVQFAMQSGDWYPLHTDQEYARQSPFGQRIAHGLLVLSLMHGLAPLIPPYVLAFYGMDRVRFVRPTFIGDTVHLEAEVADKQIRDDRSGLITQNIVVKNQRDEVVLVAGVKLVVAREAQA